MHAQGRNGQGRRLTTAGLIAVSAATIVMMAWTIFPTAAFAGSGTQQDPFGPGDKVDICHYDGSDTQGGSGKYNQPNPSVTGTGPAGHIGHEFDVIPSYYFQQNANAPVEFFAGVNWPTLTNLPSSPVDYTPLLGSSAAVFIASGCAEPSPCPSGTSTVTSTATETTTTMQTFTTTVTAGPPETLAAAGKIQAAGNGGDGPLQEEDECTTETTTTQTLTTTVPTTMTTTVPFCPEGSQTSTVTSTAPAVTTTVTVGDQVLQQPAECTTTETTVTTPTDTTTLTTSPPPTCPNGTSTTITTVPASTTSTVTDTVTETVTETRTTTITVGPAPASGAAAAQADVLQAECEETSTVTTTPTVTEHTTTTVTDSTTETTTTSGASVGPTTIEPSSTTDEVAPTTVTPGGTAFTGVENVVPLGAVALFLMSAGSGLLWAGARRRRGQGPDDEE